MQARWFRARCPTAAALPSIDQPRCTPRATARRGCRRTEGAEDDFAKGLAIVLTKLPPFTLSNHIEVQERVRFAVQRRTLRVGARPPVA